MLDGIRYYYSIPVINDGSKYEKKQVKSVIVNKFKKLITKMQADPAIALFMRGNKCDRRFIQNDLDKYYIVGEKAKFFLKNDVDRITKKYLKTKDLGKESIIDEIIQLIKVCNGIIVNKPKDHPTKGVLGGDFIKYIRKIKDIEELGNWLLFFYAWIHNNGKPAEIKKVSPCISVTIGGNMYETASKFALNRNDEGMVVVGFINTDEIHTFIKAQAIKETLKKHGVTWYDDINNEIILLNGLYPHNIFGFYHLKKKTKIVDFYINPWIVDMLEKGVSLDPKIGILINQSGFIDKVIRLGYSKYSYYICGQKKIYVGDVNDGYLSSNVFEAFTFT
ncbi:TPA: hypothetical protein DCG35_11920 [Candidatus Edwardsbacteria bacterium]|nr:hypothetical protein [Candidatus Edwardsbacteria bacterium]